MKIMLRHSWLLLLLVTAAAAAEVADSGSGGFTTVHVVTIDADRASAWKAAIEDVGKWWNSDHTVSGDASTLSITAVRQGCFCENFGAGAGVVHLTVTMVSPGVVIRLTGGLGPLGLMGVNGNMTWEFEDAEDGTKVKFTYVVGGYSAEGLDTIAGPVDFVIGEALQRLKAYIESGNPAISDIG